MDVTPEVVAKKGISIPSGNEVGANDWWRPAGRTFPGNIWENIELPRLKANPNVTKITTIDPKTEVEKIIFER